MNDNTELEPGRGNAGWSRQAAGHPERHSGWGVAEALGRGAWLIGTPKPENPALELCANARKSASRAGELPEPRLSCGPSLGLGHDQGRSSL